MAVISQINIRIKADVRGVKAEIQKVKAAVDGLRADVQKTTVSMKRMAASTASSARRTQRAIESWRKELFRLRRGISAVLGAWLLFRTAQGIISGLARSVTSMARGLTEAHAQFRRLRVTMQLLEGAAEKGNEQFRRIAELSLMTPITLKEMFEAAATMRAVGLASDQVLPALAALANISQAVGANFRDLAFVFAQSAAEQRVLARDVRQFATRNVPIVKALADVMGVAANEVFDLTQKGRIGFDQLSAAIRKLAVEDFGGVAVALGREVFGQLSRLRDLVEILRARIGEVFVTETNLPQILEAVLSLMQRIRKAGEPMFRALSDELQFLIRQFAETGRAMVSAFVMALPAVNALALAMRGLAMIVEGLSFVVSLAAQGIAVLTGQFEAAADIRDQLNEALDLNAQLRDLGRLSDALGVAKRRIESLATGLGMTRAQAQDAFEAMTRGVESASEVMARLRVFEGVVNRLVAQGASGFDAMTEAVRRFREAMPDIDPVTGIAGQLAGRGETAAAVIQPLEALLRREKSRLDRLRDQNEVFEEQLGAIRAQVAGMKQLTDEERARINGLFQQVEATRAQADELQRQADAQERIQQAARDAERIFDRINRAVTEQIDRLIEILGLEDLLAQRRERRLRDELQAVGILSQQEIQRAVQAQRFADSLKARNDAMQRFLSLERSLMSDAERMAEQVRLVQQLLQQGRIDADRAQRALERIAERFTPGGEPQRPETVIPQLIRAEEFGNLLDQGPVGAVGAFRSLVPIQQRALQRLESIDDTLEEFVTRWQDAVLVGDGGGLAP